MKVEWTAKEREKSVHKPHGLPLRQTEQNEKTALDNGEVKESRGQLGREGFGKKGMTEKMNSVFFL